MVGNDVDGNDKALVVITGANQGGKSTFLRSVGLAQVMMQSGLFVGAEAFGANIVRGVFTHYKREEDTSMASGKFDEELSRMNTLADMLHPHALILFNELFASTNEREGSEIARQIVTALLDSGLKVFFVTHLYPFAHAMEEMNLRYALFLRAERKRMAHEPSNCSMASRSRKVSAKTYTRKFLEPTPSLSKRLLGASDSVKL